MKKIIVRGGAPGLVRVELEDGSASLDVDSALNAYQALQAAQPFFQALVDATAAPAAVKSKSIAPKADA